MGPRALWKFRNFQHRSWGQFRNGVFPLKGVVDMLDGELGLGEGCSGRIGEHLSSSKLVFITRKKNYICKPVWRMPSTLPT